MDVCMPPLGASVERGTVVTWFKSVGETVVAGEPLLAVETDKTTLEIEATATGVLLEILTLEGEEAESGTPIARLSTKGAGPVDDAGRGRTGGPAEAGSPGQAQSSGLDSIGSPRPDSPATLEPFNDVRSPPRNFGPATLASGAKITPLARRLAAQFGLKPETLTGSGPNGRVVAADVRATAKDAGPPPASPRPGPEFRVVPLDRMRSRIAERMSVAKREIPHFYISSRAQVDELLRLRAAVQEAHGERVTLNDFLLKALALALARVPRARRTFAGDHLLECDNVDLGIAVSLDDGLITPVLRDIDKLTLLQVAGRARDLVDRARRGKLDPAQLGGGIATISNLGMYGIDSAQAIINPPQSFILAVGAAQRSAKEALAGGVEFGTYLSLTLSADHRVFDGAVGAQLLAEIKALLEQPIGLLE